jgi:hypothetical protein
MDYILKSIPTTYNGIRFRSRLEARWAYFFDLIGWKWEYEPYDLNGWLPDFVIHGNEDILVEVKPIDDIDEFPKSDFKKIMSAIGKDSDKEILLLGNNIDMNGGRDYAFDTCPQIGWLFHEFIVRARNQDEHKWDCEPCCFIHDGKHFGIFGVIGSWHDRIWDGHGHDTLRCMQENDNKKSKIERLWKKAKNKVQWKPN